MPSCPAPRSTLFAALLALGFVSPAVLAQTDPAAQNSPQLKPVRVESARERADGPVDGYRATRSASATRTDTALEDIPQTVTVIPAQVIDDLDLSRIDRALDLAGSVIRDNNFGGLSLDTYTVRGFTGSMAYNGFSSRTNARSPEDSSIVERIEVLKGPSAGLFGQGDPGGLIHVVTKRPQAQAFKQARLSGGSWSRYRGTLDLNMPLSSDGSVLSRVHIALEDNGSFRDHVTSERQFISPALLWQINPDTSVLLHTEFMRTKAVFDRGIVPINGNYLAMKRSTYLGEPSDGKITNNDQLLQLILEHSFNENWSLRIGSQYRHGDLRGIASDPSPNANPNLGVDGMVPRRLYARDWNWHNALSHAEVTGNFKTGSLQHQVLLGAEYERNYEYWDFSGSTVNATSYVINAWEPVYGQPRPSVSLAGLTNRLTSHALNLQDQITFNERWSGQFGIRWERYKLVSTIFGNPTSSRESEDALVPRAGLVFKATPATRVFGNVSTSFKPNGINRNTGETFKPEKGLGFEAGIKLSSADQRFGATLAAFHITKKNRTMPDPDDNTITIAAGEAVSKGFEAQANGQLTRAVDLIASYAYTHAEITKDSRDGLNGGGLGNVPRHTAALMSAYQFQQGALQGVKLGAALSYISKRRASDSSNLWLPGYSVVDLFARWPVNQSVSVHLNANNIFDRKYIESALGTRAAVGAPFNVKLGVTFAL